MKKLKAKPKAILRYCVLGLLIVALVVGNMLALTYSGIISVYFGHSTYKIVDDGDETQNTEYFKRQFITEEERLTAEAALCREIEGEGIVLLKNEGSALPITASNGDVKVSVFGVSSRDFLYGGVGSGSVDAATAPKFRDTLTEAGFSVNETLEKFYTSGRGKNYANTTANMSGAGAYKINECPESAFTKAVKNSFADYKDVAFVVFNRAGSESSDLPKASAQDSARSYLELTAEEESLLSMVSNPEYGFKKVVVIINSATPMELGFLDSEEYNISACLWVGNVGQGGMYAIGDVLTGKTNPSGALVDTYAYDTLGAPAVVNQGGYSITNISDNKSNTCMVYAEGIYVGYRYYETRYEDSVLGSGSASSQAGVTKVGADEWKYENEVQFPFGFGLSYTDFTWSDYSVSEKGDAYEISVHVTSSGSVAGKDIVQIYLQSPYTDYDRQNAIEKAAVELVGYAKISLLEPGKSETVTISVPKEYFKTYDANGQGTYILEGGEYYLTAASNAHEAINNILISKGKTEADGLVGEGSAEMAKLIKVDQDTSTYSVSLATGKSIVNLFSEADIKSIDPDFAYLTRADWEGTWPTLYKGGKWEAPASLVKAAEISYLAADNSLEMPAQSKDNGLSLAMLINADYDDEMWDELLDQMSYDDLVTLVKDGGYMIQAIESASVPGALNLDGPAGVTSAAGITVTLDEKPYSWVCEVVLASTWNDELAYKMGEMIGEDALANSQNSQRVNGWYAPAMNIHRTAYSGRNFEYYSEDSFLSGSMGASETAGATDKGLICYIKHYALNDQESNRTGVMIFANEQSIRQIYLAPFERAVRDGGALGVMVAMNRVGARWAGGHSGLMTGTLRDEWGFKGIAVTDQASFVSFAYADIREGLEAGTDMWLNTDRGLWLEQLGDYSSNPLLLNQMRRAAKKILYAVKSSLVMNGLSSTAQIVPVTPTWQKWLIAADIALGLLLLCGIALTTRALIKSKKQSAQAA